MKRRIPYRMPTLYVGSNRRHVQTVTCVRGPFAGQTVTIPYMSERMHYWSEWTKAGVKPPEGFDIVGPLCWINYGSDKHCYQLFGTRQYSSVLIYRGSF